MRLPARTCLAILLTLSPLALSAQAPPTWLEGHWEGTLDLGGQQLELRYHFQESGSAWSGTMDVPAQGATQIPLSAVQVTGERVVVVMPLPGDARYEGRWTAETETVTGTFHQAGQALPLELARSSTEAVAPVRPQEPRGPLPYRTESVHFEHEGARLAGTLTTPDGDGPFPGVVLVAGAGPHDRDGLFMGHRPLLVLSHHLTRAGVAVLRYDERGVGESEGDFQAATAAELVGDLAAAHALLADDPRVDAGRIGILAHSEGGRLAIRAMDAHSIGAFAVLLGAPATPGIQGLRAEAERSQSFAVRLQAVMAEAAVEAGSTEGARAAMREAAADLVGRLPAEQRDRAGAAVAQLSQALEQPVTRFTLGYDPGAALARIDAPVLALYGDTDGQIDAAAEAAAMEAALRGRGTVRTLAGINHFFQEAETGELSEVAASEQTLAPEVLGAILEWVGRTTGSPRATEGRGPVR